jgi:GMP reductase
MFAQNGLTYDDITLVPQYFSGNSRSELDTSVTINFQKFSLPIIPANMKCVIDEKVAEKIQAQNYLYVMHRFGVNNFNFVLQANASDWSTISISVGVKEEDFDNLKEIYKNKLRVDFITVDIAHGHCAAMKNMLYFLAKHFPSTTIIAGNVGSAKGASDLFEWGARIIKVGIGPGKSCTTRLKTGFYTPMFSTIQNVKQALQDKDCYIIADGGITYNGDIAKALVAGADLVMAGSLFAQCTDSPGQIIDGKKIFYGSASADNKGSQKNVEGRRLLLETNGMSYLEKLKEIQEDLQSSISYAGGKCITDLKQAEYIVL